MDKDSSTRVPAPANKLQRPQVERRPSVYNQRAKEGFKFWLERDPMVKRIACKNASVFYISRVFLNVRSVLLQCGNTRLRLLLLLYDIDFTQTKQ